MQTAIAVALTTLIMSAAGAVTPEPSTVEKDACVALMRIGGLRALDNRTAVIFSSAGKPSHVVTLSAPLPELEFAHRYAYIDRDRDGRLCGRSRDGIALPDESLRIPTTIMAMTPLDAKSVEALEAKYDVHLSRKRKSKNQSPEGEHEAGAADSA